MVGCPARTRHHGKVRQVGRGGVELPAGRLRSGGQRQPTPGGFVVIGQTEFFPCRPLLGRAPDTQLERDGELAHLLPVLGLGPEPEGEANLAGSQSNSGQGGNGSGCAGPRRRAGRAGAAGYPASATSRPEAGSPSVSEAAVGTTSMGTKADSGAASAGLAAPTVLVTVSPISRLDTWAWKVAEMT